VWIGIAVMFVGVVRPEHAYLAVAKRSAIIEISNDPSAVQIYRLVTGAELIPPQRSILRRTSRRCERSMSG
jgi:hypothetical protein